MLFDVIFRLFFYSRRRTAPKLVNSFLLFTFNQFLIKQKKYIYRIGMTYGSVYEKKIQFEGILVYFGQYLTYL
jgi:hypothetical protein